MSDLGNKEIFVRNLKYYMTINNKDRNDVCRDLDIPYTTFAEWYNGNIYPRIDKIQILANYFDIRKSDLVEDKQNSEKEPHILTLEEKGEEFHKQAFPILGKVKAGYNYLAQENWTGLVSIDKEVSDPENYFALSVTGNSMEPILYEDDIVIVHSQNDVENGQVGIVLINNEEATIKKIQKYDNHIELVAFNSYYPVRKLTKDDNFSIIGKVVEGRISKIFE